MSQAAASQVVSSYVGFSLVARIRPATGSQHTEGSGCARRGVGENRSGLPELLVSGSSSPRIVIAYEVNCRLVEAFDISKRGWDPPVFGLPAVALAAGRLMKLDPDQLTHAVNLAINNHIPMGQTRVGVLSNWKGLAAAEAGRNAVFAARPTRADLTGPADTVQNLSHARYPLVVEAVNHLKVRSCLIDGEVVCCDERGLATFQLLRHRRNEPQAFLYAFDLLELNGTDLRREPIEVRKATLASILRKSRPGCA